MTKTSKKWKKIGMLLNRNMAEFKDIQQQQEGDDELCWCDVMEKWLLGNGSSTYPATWEGLHSLLLDAQADDAAKLLKKAVCNAIHPPKTTPVPPPTRASPAISTSPLHTAAHSSKTPVFADSTGIAPPSQTPSSISDSTAPSPTLSAPSPTATPAKNASTIPS